MNKLLPVLLLLLWGCSEKNLPTTFIENYYRAHAHIWEGSSEQIDAKLDSLQALYCTAALQEQSQQFLESGGFDYLTLERGISAQSLEDLTVTPDHDVPNRFNVAYTAYYDDGEGNEIPQKVSFHVTVTEANNSMKISSVSE